MRALPILALALFAGSLAAGCFAPPAKQPPGPDLSKIPSVSPNRLPDPMKDFSGVIISNHGAPFMHTIRALHTGLSFGLELVGYDPLTDKLPPGAAGTGWGPMGMWKNWVCVAQFAGSGAIAIVDITDPTKPTVASQVGDPLVNGDCQFSADGNYLFAGAYLGATPTFPIPVACDSGCPAGNGINVWDVSDKANPKHILFSDTGTYHTLWVHTDEDTNITYVVQAYSGNIYSFDPQAKSLTVVNTTTPMDHDMWVSKHPITGQTLLYSGSGGGFAVYDFDDPPNAKQLSEWAPDDGVQGSEGWHRQATADQLIDGKAVVVVAGEACGAGYTLPYSVVDVTDPTSPQTLSRWEVPGKPDSTDPAHLCEMSPHEFAVHDGYVVSGNYHAGVWLFDIGSAERLRNPVTLGYYVPANEPAATPEGLGVGAQDLTFPWNPFVWGAFFDERGYILAGDFSSGLYILKIPGVSGVPLAGPTPTPAR